VGPYFAAIVGSIGLSSRLEEVQLAVEGLNDEVISSISPRVLTADPATNANHPANVVISPQS